MSQNIHLGVTGLRRTGKTVFLTSLIYQLSEVGDEGMAAFRSRGVGFKVGKFCCESGKDKFPFVQNLMNLRNEPPTWPPPTRSEFEGTISFEYQRTSAVDTVLNSIPIPLLRRGGEQRGTITIHLHDYPGEFLLDIELLELSYQQWSEQALERMQEQTPEEYRQYEQTCRELVANHPQGLNEDAKSSLRVAYTQYVQAARQRQFEMIQPGIAMDGWEIVSGRRSRPVDPGENVLPILPICDYRHAPKPILEALEQAYKQYQQERIEPFVRRLRKSTHQLVLVDVLRVLRTCRSETLGHQNYNDTRECLARIIGAYRYVEGGLQGAAKRAWRGGVRRVVFAATKADHVVRSERDHLTSLLTDLVKKAYGRVPSAARFCWFTSLRATEDGQTDSSGQEVLCGRIPGESTKRGWYPGQVPNRWETEIEIGNRQAELRSTSNYREFPEFAPRKFPALNGTPVPHLNLDTVLWNLLDTCF